MKSIRTVAVACLAAAATLSAFASPASADTAGPATKYFTAPLPVLGGLLSDSSGTPSYSVKDGWAVNDGDGICSAHTDLYRSGSGTTTVWNASSTGKSVTSLTGNKYQWTTTVGGYDYLQTFASDCLGNKSSGYDYGESSLAQEGAWSYGPGWSTSSGAIWSGGSVMKSSTAGAKATYTFSGRLVSFVSDKASNRGKVSLSVDGGTATTVTLTSSTAVNRVIAWNSTYLSSGSHLLTVKVVSGRVDIDAFLTQQ
jgi:hypothetical protein